MTNREHLIALLENKDPRLEYDHTVALRRLFGCAHITTDECKKHDTCWECWKAWLESEVTTDAK